MRILLVGFLIVSGFLKAEQNDTSRQLFSIGLGKVIPRYFFEEPGPGAVLDQSSFKNYFGSYLELNFRRKLIGVSIGYQYSGRAYEINYLHPPYWYSTKTEKHYVSNSALNFQMSFKFINKRNFRSFVCARIMNMKIREHIIDVPVKDTVYGYWRPTSHYSDSRSFYNSIGVLSEINVLKQCIYLQTQVNYVTQIPSQNKGNSERHFALNVGFNFIMSNIFRKEGFIRRLERGIYF